MRTRRRGVTLIAAAALLAACTSSSDDELDLGTSAQAAPDVTVSPDPDPEDTDPPETQEPEEPLYPPLPGLEPDPDSDIPVEVQVDALERHARVHEVMQRAYHTLEGEREDFEAVLFGTVLDDFQQNVEERRARGVHSRSPDTRIDWVRVTEASTGPVEIQECRIVGPESGLYDIESGEQVDEPVDEFVAVVVEFTYRLLDLDGEYEYRATEITSELDPERCSA